MKKLVILGAKDPQGKNDVSLLGSAIEKRAAAKYLTVTMYFEDLVFDISQSSQRIWDAVSGMDLADADLVIAFNWYKAGSSSFYKDVALAVGLYLQSHKVEVWNKEILLQRSTTKLSAMMQLAINGFDIPRTAYSLSPQLLIKEAQAFPIVLKAMAASRGKNNFLVKSQSELEDLLAKNSQPNQFIIQEYIPNDGDFRIICFAGEPVLAINRRRRSNSTHLNNTSLGAEASLVPLDKLDRDIISDCKKICTIMGRDMAGIDLIQANDGLSRQVFLEINAIPQLTSGTYVNNKLDFLSESITKYLES